ALPLASSTAAAFVSRSLAAAAPPASARCANRPAAVGSEELTLCASVRRKASEMRRGTPQSRSALFKVRPRTERDGRSYATPVPAASRGWWVAAGPSYRVLDGKRQEEHDGHNDPSEIILYGRSCAGQIAARHERAAQSMLVRSAARSPCRTRGPWPGRRR